MTGVYALSFFQKYRKSIILFYITLWLSEKSDKTSLKIKEHYFLKKLYFPQCWKYVKWLGNVLKYVSSKEVLCEV